jgi:lactose/L-arabinose transport system ATP-binding protein
MTLADRIVVMRDGKVEQTGTPEDLYEDPENLFVAGFIGSPRMNFLRAKPNGSGQIALQGGATLTAPNLDASSDAAVLVGVRPEHFVPPATADVVLDLHVDVVEYLGGTRYIYGTLSSGEALIVEARDMPRPKAGDPIRIGFHTVRALLFSNGGKRLRPA